MKIVTTSNLGLTILLSCTLGMGIVGWYGSQRLADLLNPACLPRRQIRGFQTQRVVFVFRDILFVRGGFISRLSGALEYIEVNLKLFQ